MKRGEPRGKENSVGGPYQGGDVKSKKAGALAEKKKGALSWAQIRWGGGKGWPKREGESACWSSSRDKKMNNRIERQ